MKHPLAGRAVALLLAVLMAVSTALPAFAESDIPAASPEPSAVIAETTQPEPTAEPASEPSGDQQPSSSPAAEPETPSGAQPAADPAVSEGEAEEVQAPAPLAEPAGGYVPRDKIAAIEADSSQAGYEPEKAIDGVEDDPNNCWHSPWQGEPIPGFPHWLMVTFTEPQTLESLTYVARDAKGFQFVTRYEVWVSETADQDDFVKVAEGSWSRAKTAVAEFDTVKALRVKFVMLEKVDSNGSDTTSVSASEIKFGLADLSESNQDALFLPQIERAKGAVAFGRADCGEEAHQVAPSDLAALEADLADLESLLGGNYTKEFAQQRVRQSEQAVQTVLHSGVEEGEEAAPAIPSSSMSASANTQQAGYEASNAVDGSLDTIWHTAWDPENVPVPHHLTVDLGHPFWVNQVVVTPRQDMATGYILQGEIWAGNDPENLSKVAEFLGTANGKPQAIELPVVQARYVEIRSLQSNSANTAVAEVEVHTYDRGWVSARAALDAAYFTADNAVAGGEVGQFDQADLDAFNEELAAFAGQLEGKRNSEYYALAEQIRSAQEQFADKAHRYTAEDLKQALDQAEALLDTLNDPRDKASLESAMESARAALNSGDPDEIHQQTGLLREMIRGLENAQLQVVDLSGSCKMNLSAYTEGMEYSDTVQLPGTLDTNRKGTPNSFQDPKRLSRYFLYTGPASYEREIYVPHSWEGQQAVLYLERSRATRVWVNGTEVPGGGSASMLPVAQQYDLGAALEPGKLNTITVVVDNSYPGMPSAAIRNSSMATEETQTNWNGIVGRMELQIKPDAAIRDLRVYPNDALDGAEVQVDLTNVADEERSGTLTVQVDGETVEQAYTLAAGESATVTVQLAIPDARLWSEYDPFLYTVQASLDNGSTMNERFGMRRFAVEDGRFAINGSPVFLRSEANCAVFPLTAYAPMDQASWEKLFATYQSYGLNSVRFHSWCPPEAAFDAADEMGMYLFPELSSWDAGSMFGDAVEKDYYTRESMELIREYANHPSFVGMTFGNELVFAGDGAAFANELLGKLKAQDSTRLYAGFSNGNYGNYAPMENADFFTGQTYRGTVMRGIFAGMSGFINQTRPGSTANYDEAVQRAKNDRNMPVYSFEVGQFQVFPDVLTEMDDYTGVLEPRNLQLVTELLEEKGVSDETIERYINASGMLSQLGYRMEFEAALRTEDFGGISLLGIQDFSGQGTALVGMMNSLGDPKPYEFADPETFRQWSNQVVALLETEKFCYTNDETVTGRVLLSNYGPETLNGTMTYRLYRQDGTLAEEGGLAETAYPQGELTEAGTLNLSLKAFTKPEQLRLEIGLGDVTNSYDLWVYPADQQVQEGQVYVTGALDEMARMVLEDGGSVLLSPAVSKSTLPNSITGTFTTAFWSSQFVSESQPGSMGLLMDPEHPVFGGFPTEYYTNYQWWAMAKLGRPMILECVLDTQGNQIQPLIQVIDSFAQVRTMGLLFEAKVGNGKLMVSSMGLDQLEKDYPEAKALKASILDYMNSDAFDPTAELTVEQIDSLVNGSTTVSRKNLAEKSNGGVVELAEGTYTCQEGYDRDPQDRAIELNDGVVDTSVGSRSWSDWNAGKNYPDVVMTAVLNDTYLIDTVDLPSFEDSGCKAPAGIQLEYWDGSAFVPVENPSRTSGFSQGHNEITFDAVKTDRIRFTFSHQAGMGLAISEIMVFEKQIMPQSIQVTAKENTSSVQVGKTLSMQAAFTPADATAIDVRWAVVSEDGSLTELAQIDSSTGVLTARAPGKVLVRARLVADPTVVGEMLVTVTGAPQPTTAPQPTDAPGPNATPVPESTPAVTVPAPTARPTARPVAPEATEEPDSTPEPTAAPESTPVPEETEPTPEDIGEPETPASGTGSNGTSWLIWVVAAVLACAAVLVIIMVIRRRRES